MSGLKQNIGVFSGIGIAVGMVVGSGLFGLPGLAIDLAGADLSIYGWLATILITIPMIYIFIKLGMKFPKASGLSKYAEVAFGKWGGHGVTAVLSGTFTIGIPALAMIGGEYLCKLLDINTTQTYIFAICFLILATIINILGVKVASWINNISLVFIFLLITILIFMHPEYLKIGLMSFTVDSPVRYDSLWIVMALLFWAFLGWENLSFGLEEFKNPDKNIPIVYWGSFFIVSIFYFLLALISSGAVKSGVDISGMSGVASLFEVGFIGKFLVFFIVLVILANANSWVFGASRLIYSASENKILPTFLSKLNTNSIPRNSLMTLGGFYILFILGIKYFEVDISKIIMVVSQNFLVLYAATIIAFAKLFNGILNRIILVLSLFILVFFLSNFGFSLAYPLVLLFVGFIAYTNKH